MLINPNYKKIILLLSSILGLLVFVLPVQAAELAWQEVKNDNSKQAVFILRLTTNNNERENAWSGQINFDARQLKLQSISDAHSLVSLWLERPSVKNTGSIIFSGITPGGFSGSGEILRLVFDLSNSGSAMTARNSIKIANFEALLGNGSGQMAKVTISPVVSMITDDKILNDLTQDQTAPELTWQITNENLISTDWQLSANAFDKQSGVRYVAMATTSNYLGPFAGLISLNPKLNWQKITGPQVLTKSELNHVIFIKSVDNAGNVKLIKLYPLRAYLFVLFCIIIIGLILCLFL
ncbi:MAG: hypothetical protein NT041_01950 [Candidatus Vogelbacteria bacterium]|nr:hypothetical protein [Candidatus Vogelbacteria bacterium]